MDIGNLLEFERALQRHRIVEIPTDKENILCIKALRRKILDFLFILQRLFNLIRKFQQRLYIAIILCLRNGPKFFGKINGNQIDHRQLCAVGFSGCNRDLRPCPGIDHVVGVVGNRTAHNIDNRERPRAKPFGFPHRGKGVCCFAGLADHQDERT